MLFESIVNHKGISHIGYKISGIDDIINHYSVPGYELLNPSFESYMTKVMEYIPYNTPVVLDIVGADLTGEERERADNAIWNNYLLKVSDSKLKIRHSLTRTFWYLLSALASCVLIVIGNSGHFDDLVIQFLYLPIWYFGYRVLTYPIFDCLPLWKKSIKFRQMACLKLRFSPGGLTELSDAECAQIRHDFTVYFKDSSIDTRHGKMIDWYMMDGKVAEISVKVSGTDDIIRSSSIPDHELISDDMSYYLSNVEKFIRKDVSVRFSIVGHKFSDSEKKTIIRAVHNHAEMLKDDAKAIVNTSNHKIIAFSICLLIAVIILSIFGEYADVALHEMIIILFWFFGDYLFEFVLIDYVDSKKSLAVAKNIEKLKIDFIEK